MSEIRASELPLDLLEHIDAACDAFERAWAEGGRPRIEEHLDTVPEAARSRLSAELIRVEMEQRWRRGEQPTLEEYRQRFPAWADAMADWLDETREAAERSAAADKATDDPRILATLDEPQIASTASLPPRLVGEYEVLGPLGSGGMGDVYKARHRRLGKLVALKLLPADAPHPRQMAARFQREMQAVGSLDHPNVVEAHDAGEQSGVVYLAMKLIDGVDLDRLVKQRGPLPIAEACQLVRQAALGLHYLHQRSLIHRDVKPSNLMRTADGTVKVLDLGLARWRVETEAGPGLTGTGRVLGTPDFLAPEQIENAASADARADLYGLGCTLFYLLTGRAPFAHRESLWAKLDAHRTEIPPDVRTLRPDVPPALAELVGRLLAKKPQERYQTAAEVASALEPFAQISASEATRAVKHDAPPPAPAEEKPNRRGGRKRAAVSLTIGRWSCALTLTLGMAAVILAGLPVCWWYSQYQHSKVMDTSPEPNSGIPEPIHVISLDVKLTRNVNGRGLPAGLLGKKVFDPHVGDRVTLQARLTRPAYAFLIAFRPDGVSEVCFPEKEDQRPELTEKPSYPFPISKGSVYELTDGTGLAAFAVIVSSTPLPSFKEWWSRREDCPWKQEKASPGLVYRANGEDEVEALDVEGSRGKGAMVEGKTPIAELASWLLHAPQVDTVQVLGFAVAAKEDP